MSALNTDSCLQPRDRIRKANRDLILDVLSSFRFASRRSFEEHLGKHVGFRRRGAKDKTLEAESPGCLRFLRIEDALGIKAVVIVELPLQRIAEDFISL